MFLQSVLSLLRCSYSFLLVQLTEASAHESKRFLVTAQADCGYQACRSENQAEPQTRVAQEPPGSQLCERNKMRIDRDAILILEVESGLAESKQSAVQHVSQKRG